MHLPSQPVVLEVQRGVQVVQDDSAGAYDDPAFQRMLEAYGGLAAQIVTPVMRRREARGDPVAPPARRAAGVDERGDRGGDAAPRRE